MKSFERFIRFCVQLKGKEKPLLYAPVRAMPLVAQLGLANPTLKVRPYSWRPYAPIPCLRPPTFLALSHRPYLSSN